MDIANMGKKLQELEAKRKFEYSDWSREGCIQQYKRGLNEGEGLHPPPHVLPYKPIGIQLDCHYYSMDCLNHII